jgi:exopolysaccharide production protein ExoZ
MTGRNLMMHVTVLPFTSVLAYLSFRYFETPPNTWLRKILHLPKLPLKSVRNATPEMRPTAV